jgi:DNA-binding HxlR family transcriptional regulator
LWVSRLRPSICDRAIQTHPQYQTARRPSSGLRRVTRKRAYKRFDPLAVALEQIGDRWTLFVIRALMNGPQRYSDLRAYLTGAGSNVLTDRLRQLAESRIVGRTAGDRPGTSTTYHLTERGWTLAPVIEALVRFGLSSLLMTAGAETSPDREVFDQSWAIPDPTLVADETYQWTVDGVDFSLEVRTAELQIVRTKGRAVHPAATLMTSAAVLDAVVSGRSSWDSVAGTDQLILRGSAPAIDRMFTAVGFAPRPDLVPRAKSKPASALPRLPPVPASSPTSKAV